MKAYRRDGKTPKTFMSFQLAPATADRLTTLARETGRSRSATVNDIIEEFFAEEDVDHEAADMVASSVQRGL